MNILGEDGGAAPRPARPRTRIIKVKRADLEAAIAAGELEEIEEDDAPAAAATPAKGGRESSLSPEEEADLMRELAEVEAELAGTAPADAPAEDPAQMAPETAPETAESAPPAGGRAAEDQDDVSRLMETAAAKLDDPEASTNRATYSQMRAAVAAAEAERSAGGTVGLGNDDDPYRADLATVVRPRRPASGERRASRPLTGGRPAPLKLVAEQRVDDGAEAPRAPIRPRRVATELLDDQPSGQADEGFAQFAAEMGAKELPELLEAAAAYLSFVEGREQFSRPQLMSKVRQADLSDFNREDGLRSFGQLLRDGKIRKTGGGRFTASGAIGFRPDGERAAG